MLILACDRLTKLPLSCSPESPEVAAAASSEASTSTAASQSEIVDFIKSALGKLEGKYVTLMNSLIVFSTWRICDCNWSQFAAIAVIGC